MTETPETSSNPPVSYGDVVDNFTSRHDFAMGEIYGLRGWTIDEKGRLRGVSNPEILKPGVNTASCSVAERELRAWNERRDYAERRKQTGPLIRTAKEMLYDYDELIPKPVDHYYLDDDGNTRARYRSYSRFNSTVDEKPPVHDRSACTCGYHAYFSTHARESRWGQIQGVIKAYGQTTIGSKGFRAEKSELVALTLKGYWARRLAFNPLLRALSYILPRRNFLAGNGSYASDDHEGLGLAAFIAGAISSIFGLGMTLAGAILGDSNVLHPGLGLLLFGGYCALFCFTDESEFRRIGTGVHRDQSLTFHNLSLEKKAEHLRKTYPGVKIYSSRRAMLRHHPVSKLSDFVPKTELVKQRELPTPETDPNFWSE